MRRDSEIHQESPRVRVAQGRVEVQGTAQDFGKLRIHAFGNHRRLVDDVVKDGAQRVPRMGHAPTGEHLEGRHRQRVAVSGR